MADAQNSKPVGASSADAKLQPSPQQNTFVPLDSANHAGESETKIVLISGFSDKQLHDFIDAYRGNKALPKAIFATVTEQSLQYKLKDLLAELELEKKQIDAAAAAKRK